MLDHVVDAGLADPARLGCSDLSYGGYMVNWLIGTSDRFAAAVSENASRIRSLMLQAADDLRCPIADTEQLFTALRWPGREVVLVRYPGEHHTFQGAGRFDRRADRHRRELDWFARHMPA